MYRASAIKVTPCWSRPSESSRSRGGLFAGCSHYPWASVRAPSLEGVSRLPPLLHVLIQLGLREEQLLVFVAGAREPTIRHRVVERADRDAHVGRRSAGTHPAGLRRVPSV